MAVNDFSVGRDVSLDITTPTGPKRFKLITGFSSKQECVDIKVKGLDGVPKNIYLPDGWSGSFDLERQNRELQDFFCDLESQYYGGTNLGYSTITETIQEPNGGIAQYRYENVVFKLDDGGDIKGDSTIKQRATWLASFCKKVA